MTICVHLQEMHANMQTSCGEHKSCQLPTTVLQSQQFIRPPPRVVRVQKFLSARFLVAGTPHKLPQLDWFVGVSKDIHENVRQSKKYAQQLTTIHQHWRHLQPIQPKLT